MGLAGVGALLWLVFEAPPQHRFIDAAGKKDPEKLKAWLQRGMDVNKKGLVGLTALYSAIQAKQVENMRLLLAAGADYRTPVMGCPALHTAIMENFYEGAELLLEAGADPHQPGLLGISAFAGAATSGQVEYVQLMLRYGAQPDRVDPGKDPVICDVAILAATSRHESEREKLRQVLAALLAAGANPNVRTRQDFPAIAAGLSDVRVLRMLVDHGTITDVAIDGVEIQPQIDEMLAQDEIGSSAPGAP
jgi:ankyrin repeat protein